MQKNTDTRTLNISNALKIRLVCILSASDGVIKYAVIKQLLFFKKDFLDSFLYLALYKNYGIAFNIPIPLWLTLIISGSILIFLIRLIAQFHKENSLYFLPMILILAGALNNFIDRLINGFTTDYLIFFNLSAINIADILIVTGAVLTMWYSFNSTGIEKR